MPYVADDLLGIMSEHLIPTAADAAEGVRQGNVQSCFWGELRVSSSCICSGCSSLCCSLKHMYHVYDANCQAQNRPVHKVTDSQLCISNDLVDICQKVVQLDDRSSCT